MASLVYTHKVEKWGVFEAQIYGKSQGNPFTDYTITAHFSGKNESRTVDGFYDGEGIYRVRFMPSFEGEYSFRVSGSFSEEIHEGTFTVTPAGAANHGPVRVSRIFHFAYEDGKPYYSLGTTCYVWNLQSQALQEQTLESLKNGPFNKIRFCIWPKHYDYNLNEPVSYPYEGTPMDSSVLTSENFLEYQGCPSGNSFDYKRFNPKHFQHIDSCVEKLRDMGIQADLIVMHPYDRWGFSQMDAECDSLYWKYVIARLAAYRNVWWSLANEYDLFPSKTVADWERIARILCEKDPYSHLRSIHNCRQMYDYSRPWITHCSIQRVDLYKSAELVNEWRERYRKPVVLDEIAYEGDIQHGWGNITGQEMTRRFWEAFVRGGYPGHGETFLGFWTDQSGRVSDEADPGRETSEGMQVLWWAHGGRLQGESPARIRFLKTIMDQTPEPGLRPLEGWWDAAAGTVDLFPAGKGYYLFYFSFMRPAFRDFYFNDDKKYRVEVIDTWNMTIEDTGICSGHFRVKLPGRQYMAVRIRETDSACGSAC